MAKSLFDHVGAIYNNQKTSYYDELSDADKKSFSPYMVNMAISMVPDFLPVVNEANKYWDQLDARSLYLLYSQALPKGKYYNKWVKGKKEDKYESWLVELVARKYEVSEGEARDYLDLFYRTDEGREELRNICVGYGLDQKKLKKVKL